MNAYLLGSFLTLAMVRVASASEVFAYEGASYAVPDGNPSGVWTRVTVSNLPPVLTDLSVTLHLTGGYNGDLYAYLNHEGSLVPLLNRIGVSGGNPFGFTGAGMEVVLSDSAAANIHAAGNGILTGMYRPDGQSTNPLSASGSFAAAGGAITLNGTFGGTNPNGAWTLFLADVVSGGNASVVNTWSLTIATIPEPSFLSLQALGLFVGCVAFGWQKRNR